MDVFKEMQLVWDSNSLHIWLFF